eukprot:evm.model.NODE_26701_length_15182_cov_13.348966.3
MVVGVVVAVVVVAVLPGVVVHVCVVEETYQQWGNRRALRLEAGWIGGQATVPNGGKSPDPGEGGMGGTEGKIKMFVRLKCVGMVVEGQTKHVRTRHPDRKRV